MADHQKCKSVIQLRRQAYCSVIQNKQSYVTKTVKPCGCAKTIPYKNDSVTIFKHCHLLRCIISILIQCFTHFQIISSVLALQNYEQICHVFILIEFYPAILQLKWLFITTYKDAQSHCDYNQCRSISGLCQSCSNSQVWVEFGKPISRDLNPELQDQKRLC